MGMVGNNYGMNRRRRTNVLGFSDWGNCYGS